MLRIPLSANVMEQLWINYKSSSPSLPITDATKKAFYSGAKYIFILLSQLDNNTPDTIAMELLKRLSYELQNHND